MRILAVANAHALAHVSRLLEIAKVLRSRGHDVSFAGHGKYLSIAAQDDFRTHDLPYISVQRVVDAVRSQRLWTLYRKPELEQFIAAELALYDEVKPDLVLLDNRPSARTSADIAGIRTAAVLNVHMSNYRRIPFVSYRQLAPKLPGMDAADRIENTVERAVYDRVVMSGLNAIRAARGLPARYAYEHEEGDVSCLADLPEFNPVVPLPRHVRFVGPLTWRNAIAAPRCLERLDSSKPTAYMSLGSEGLEELVPHLGALTEQGIQVVIATGAVDGAHERALPGGVFVERYVNTALLMPHCDVVCCHGGNGTLYQAMSHGLPCIVVATHAEQHYGGKRIRELGLGLSLRLKHVRKQGIGTVVAAVRHVLASPGFRKRSQAFAELFGGWANSATRAADTMEARSSR